MIWTYLAISFIVFFFSYKLYGKKKKEQEGFLEMMMETNLFLLIFLSLIWIMTVPCFFLWKLLERLTKNKFN